jgi:superoxide dismutase, Fe-Mn family
MNNRRSFLKKLSAASAFALVAPSFSVLANSPATTFSLPPLPYSPDALEPFIDKLTMEIHHGKHHKAYVDNLNKAVAENELAKGKTLEQLMAMMGQLPQVIRNNGGGHYNHSLFWTLLAPAKGQQPGPQFTALVNGSYGSIDKFKEEFAKAGMQRFGSGWAWAIVKNGKLVICSTPNQDNPLMDIAEPRGFPILALDVWEHAYYLKYQNLRADYIKAFWNVVNWDEVEKRIKLSEGK